MNQIETELETAIATARDALARFREDPMTPSKRGGPRLSPWWRVYVQSSEVAARWHRQLERGKPEHNTPWPYDEALDRLLDEQQG